MGYPRYDALTARALHAIIAALEAAPRSEREQAVLEIAIDARDGGRGVGVSARTWELTGWDRHLLEQVETSGWFHVNDGTPCYMHVGAREDNGWHCDHLRVVYPRFGPAKTAGG